MLHSCLWKISSHKILIEFFFFDFKACCTNLYGRPKHTVCSRESSLIVTLVADINLHLQGEITLLTSNQAFLLWILSHNFGRNFSSSRKPGLPAFPLLTSTPMYIITDVILWCNFGVVLSHLNNSHSCLPS